MKKQNRKESEALMLASLETLAQLEYLQGARE